MHVKVFNVCLFLGWLMVLAGGVVIHPGWGIAIAGAVLLVGTLLVAYLVGFAPATPAQKPAEGEAG